MFSCIACDQTLVWVCGHVCTASHGLTVGQSTPQETQGRVNQEPGPWSGAGLGMDPFCTASQPEGLGQAG